MIIKEYKIEVSESDINPLMRCSIENLELRNLIVFMITHDMMSHPKYKEYNQEYIEKYIEYEKLKTDFSNKFKSILKSNETLLSWSLDFETKELIYKVREE